MPNLIVLKTHPEHLDQVVQAQRHALQTRLLKAQPGDLLLLAETRSKGSALVRYGMRFRGQRIARPGETESMWNKSWRYIIEGEDCKALERAFSPQIVKVSSANYGQGGPFVYIDPEDADAFKRDGLLKPFA